ncbi:DNA polymerase gamma 1, partial [Phenoliferia sp. Uapishka_3]
MEPGAVLLKDARYTLGKELDSEYAPPATFLAALQRFRKSHPASQLFIDLHAGDGFGTASCLHCQESLNLTRDVSEPDGGLSVGFGTLSTFGAHLDSEDHKSIVQALATSESADNDVKPDVMMVDTDHEHPAPPLSTSRTTLSASTSANTPATSRSSILPSAQSTEADKKPRHEVLQAQVPAATVRSSSPAAPIASTSRIIPALNPHFSPTQKRVSGSEPERAVRTLSSIAFTDDEEDDGGLEDSEDDVDVESALMAGREKNAGLLTAGEEASSADEGVRPLKLRRGSKTVKGRVVYDSDDEAPAQTTPQRPTFTKTSSASRRPASDDDIVILSGEDKPSRRSSNSLGKRRAVTPSSSDSDVQFVTTSASASKSLSKKSRPSPPPHRRSPSRSPHPVLSPVLSQANQEALLELAVNKLAANKKLSLSDKIIEKIKLKRTAASLGIDWDRLYEGLFKKSGAGSTPARAGPVPNRFEKEMERLRDEEEVEVDDDGNVASGDGEPRPKKKEKRKDKKERLEKEKREAAKAKKDAIAAPNLTALEAARKRVKDRQNEAKKKKIAIRALPDPDATPAKKKNGPNVLDQLGQMYNDLLGGGIPGARDKTPVDPDEIEFQASAMEIAEFNQLVARDDHKKNVTVLEAVAKLGLESTESRIPGMSIKLLPFQVNFMFYRKAVSIISPSIFQLISVAWMNEREQAVKAPGGILADDMGLGKTAQAITIMNMRQSDDARIRTNLVIAPLSLLEQWQSEINNDNIVKKEKEHPLEAVETSQIALAPIVMRRLKTDLLEGKPLVPLKGKATTIEELDFDADERQAYDAAESEAQVEILKYLKRGTLLKNMSHVLTSLVAEDESNAVDYAAELLRAEKLLGGDVVQRLLDQRLTIAVQTMRFESTGKDEDAVPGDDECSLCLEPVQAETGIVTSCGHRFCKECIDELFTKEALDDGLRKNERSCPNCRAPISQDKFFDLDTFEPTDDLVLAQLSKSDFTPQEGAPADMPGSPKKAEPIVLDSESDSETPPPAPKRTEVITIESDSDDDMPSIEELFKSIKPKVEVKPELPVRDIKPMLKKGKPKAMKTAQEKGKGKEKAAPKVKLDFTSVIPSTKLKEMHHLIKEAYREDKLVKTIVISSFVSALDLCDQYLTYKHVPTVRFQGSMNQEDRKIAIDSFKNDPDVRVMLLSLKAGGVGLNLTMASRVVTLDVAWSEAVENQAIDRVYRLGQGRDVIVKRLTARDTIVCENALTKENRVDTVYHRRSASSSFRKGRGSIRSFLWPHDAAGEPKRPSLVDVEPPPLNVANVPLISPHLQSQLFPPPSSPFSPSPASHEAIGISLEHLRKNGLISSTPLSKPPPPAIDFTLPRLQGPTISHHFHSIAADVAEPYLSLAKSYAESSLPKMPEKERWVLVPGWTQYSNDGSCESVDYPNVEDKAMVFDVETLPYQGGHFPIMAVAVGKKAWYGWCSPWLTGDDVEPNHLIPFNETAQENESENLGSKLIESEDSSPRLLIGHHVLFDRARVSSEYTLRRPSTRWLDTLSLHVAVSGLTSPQRPAWLKHRKEVEERAVAAKEAKKQRGKGAAVEAVKPPASPLIKSWKDVASINSLVEVARLHCGTKVDKSLRDVLIDPTTTLEDVRSHFHDLIAYCAMDVKITSDVFQVLLPKFLATCPHPASFAGVALMSQPILPVDRRWPEYIERAEKTYDDRSRGVKVALMTLAEEARAKMDEKTADGRYVWEDDHWLRQLDWSPKKARRLPGAVPSKKRAAAVKAPPDGVPLWNAALKRTDAGAPIIPFSSPLSTLLLRTTWKSHPIVHTHSHGYLFAVSGKRKFVSAENEELVDPMELGPKDEGARNVKKGAKLFKVPTTRAKGCVRTLFGSTAWKKVEDGTIASPYDVLQLGLSLGSKEVDSNGVVTAALRELSDEALKMTVKEREKDPWLRQLDWSLVQTSVKAAKATADPPTVVAKGDALVWPKWYWDLDTPGLGLDVSIKQRAAPLLLKLRWRGYPVVYSKEHRWAYRIPREEATAFLTEDTSLSPLEFKDVADTNLFEDAQSDAVYIKLPHPDGDGLNVGSPLSKAYVSAFDDDILTSEYSTAADALALNASCSYWTSARERITNQMVVWEGAAKTPSPTPAAIASDPSLESTQGLILPQVIPMGTVTRRAVEKTWLTASNAKKNRVGSELKSMVRAPEGYAIVGADVDSEELWICSVMGDAQFGIHGATAIGWMTLEGTKSAGTDLHSKSASILGITRDDAKVFNYSRIYGAGVKHAVQLLLKSNPKLTTDKATDLAKNLYAQTKGLTDRGTAFQRDFWHGGTESFVFNKLEQIAHSDRPRTPALGCGLTDALKKQHLPADGRDKAGQGYMPSRINWVVQSSGVDYLHLLIVSMEYLCKRFGIDARYMISVHDEVRYLVKEEDKYRAAMAMQVSNVWTRALFSYRLQIGDLPQSCAFFSAVDLDHCFRKEVNMSCITPSNPDPIPFGESLDISGCLSATNSGSLFPDLRPMTHEVDLPDLKVPTLTESEIKGETHRVTGTDFLIAQTLETKSDVQDLWRSVRSSYDNGTTRRPLRDNEDLIGSIHRPAKVVRTQRSGNGTTTKRAPRMSNSLRKDDAIADLQDEDNLVPEEYEDEYYSETAAATVRTHI